MSLSRRLILLKLLGSGVLKTVTGALLQIVDALAKPAKKLVVSFEAVQEGEGDPSPENIRPIVGWTGVDVLQSSANLLPLTLPVHAFAGTFSTDSTTISSATNARCWSFYVGKNQKLIYQKKSGAGNVPIMIAFADSLLMSRTDAVIYDALNCASRNDTVVESGEHPYIVINTSNASTLTPETGLWDVNESMLSFGNTRKEYSPRTDLTTIPIVFPSNSKNLYDERRRTEYFYINQEGVIAADSNSCYSDLIPVVAGETYTWSGVQNSSLNNNKRVHAYADGVWQSQITMQSVTESGAFAITFQIPSGANQIRVSEYMSDTNVQIELGSTATTYEEYTQYYGGTLDVTTAVLTLTKYGVDLSRLTWETRYTGDVNKTLSFSLADNFSNNLLPSFEKRADYILEQYSYQDYITSINNLKTPDDKNVGFYIYHGDASEDNVTRIYLVIPKEQTPSGMFVYDLNSVYSHPTYQLTPTQVQMLQGANNIWCDASDDLELTYLAQAETQ